MALCRTCLDPLHISINLFESCHKDILDVLQRLLAFQVFVEGGEFNICRACHGTLSGIAEFQLICLRSVNPLDDSLAFIKTERSSSPLNFTEQLINDDANNVSPLAKLDIRLERCPRVEELIATKYTVKEVLGSDEDEVDDEVDEENHSAFGENSDLDSDYAPSEVTGTKRKRQDGVSNDDEDSNGIFVRSSRTRCRQYPYEHVLHAIKDAQNYKTDAKYRTCLLCNFICNSVALLRKHLVSEHKYIQNICKYCNVQVDDLQQHRESIQCHRWQCRFCTMHYATLRSLTIHLQWHCRTKFDVSVKLQQLPKNDILQAIEKTYVNKDVKGRECILCGYIGNEAGYLKIHMCGAHKIEYKNWCLYCNIITDNLKDHLKSVKCSEEQCPYCSGSFKNLKYLKSHLPSHCREELLAQMQQIRSNDIDDVSSDSLSETSSVELSSIGITENQSFPSNHKDQINDDTSKKSKTSRLDTLEPVKMTEQTRTFDLQLPNDNDHPTDDSDGSDSDYHTRISKQRRKQVLSLARQKKDNTKRTTFKHKQYKLKIVLEAIDKVNSRITDMKYRQCKLCDFIGEKATVLQAHVRKKHKDLQNWCGFCNIQTEDIKQHRDTLKCNVPLCSLCGGVYSSKVELFKHLRSHCHKYKTALSKAAIEGKKVTYKQYPEEEVLQAITDCRSKITEAREIACIHCDFKDLVMGPLAIGKLANHMRHSHKDNLLMWCKRCNVQTENLTVHLETSKCSEIRCTFCNKGLNKNNKMITHLKSHCVKKFGKTIKFHRNNDDVIANPTPKSLTANYVCTICNKKFRNLQLHMFQKHNDVSKTTKPDNDSNDLQVERTVKGRRKQLCSFCGKGFTSFTVLAVHLAKMHNETNLLQNNFECTICSKTFHTESGLRQHIPYHQNVQPFICDVCGKKSLTQYWHNKHMEDHKKNMEDDLNWYERVPQTLPTVQKCGICQKTFRHLKLHMIKKHNMAKGKKSAIGDETNSNKGYLCAYCGKICQTPTTLIQHNEKVHGEKNSMEREFKCSICTKSFQNPGTLKQHVMRHEVVDPIICNICGKSCSSKLLHKRHMEEHINGPKIILPLQCPSCDKKYYSRKSFKLHLRLHAGTNQFHCIPCGKSFAYKCLLQTHLRKHDDSQPHECNVCGKWFKTEENYKKHKVIHTGQQPYKCTFCPYKSSKSHCLTNHMKQHPEDTPQADKPYKCPLCHRSFSTNALLISHIDHSHISKK